MSNEQPPSGTAAAGSPAMPIIETDVVVRTHDGDCDAVLAHPTTGAHPGVLMWPDGLGLRQAFRDMAGRLAGRGYAVLVPNPFYRAGKAPLISPSFSFSNPTDTARVKELQVSTTPANIERDAIALVDYLDRQPAVRKGGKIGTHGYGSMLGLPMRTAAAVRDRIGAGATFHCGNLVTGDAQSAHLLAAKIKARFYIAIAANDDQKEPGTKESLRIAFEEANNPADIEVYPGTSHGWCVRGMPTFEGKQLYHHEQAERAWENLLALYDAILA